jgi:DNA-binding NtrC family response regulator
VLPRAEASLARERERGATAATGFAPETAEVLKGYFWPGNVRELRSVVEAPAAGGRPTGAAAQLIEQPATFAGATAPHPKDVSGVHPLGAQPVAARSGGGQQHPRKALGRRGALRIG